MGATLTLSGIAALARVQRPVVSVWRKRAAHTEHPFPESAATVGTQQLFDADEVVRWLTATGRGNNPDPAVEVPMYGSLVTSSSDDEGVIEAGLEALLALRASLDSPLVELSRLGLLDLADDVDPDDQAVFSELEALGDRLEEWAAHADAMSEAAFGARNALEAFRSRRAGGVASAADRTELDGRLLRWAARLLAELSPAGTPVDLGGGARIAVERWRDIDPVDRPRLLLRERRDEAARADRRLLLAHGWRCGPMPSPGSADRLGDAVGLVRIPHVGAPVATAAEVLVAIEDAVLDTPAHVPLVVLAPAPALVDPLPKGLDRVRSDLLRTGRVRAVVRFPEGLRPAHPRERWALWLIGPAPEGVAAADRWVAVADLGPGDVDAVDDLIVDLVASRDAVAARGHAFRFARLVPADLMQSSRGSLVGGVSAPQPASRAEPASVAARVRALLDGLGGPVEVPEIVALHGERLGARRTTVGALVDDRVVRRLPGHRLAPADVSEEGAGVPVLGPDELFDTRRLGERTVDRLHLAALPRVRLTEPGDVVLCATPRPMAVVDVEGASVVEAPAFVLRVVRPDLVSQHLLADAVRRAGARTPWRSWTLPVLPRGQVDAIEAALRGLAATRAELVARLADLDTLVELLGVHVPTGALALDTTAVAADDLGKEG